MKYSHTTLHLQYLQLRANKLEKCGKEIIVWDGTGSNIISNPRYILGVI